jgi:hypothetical protein
VHRDLSLAAILEEAQAHVDAYDLVDGELTLGEQGDSTPSSVFFMLH